VTTKQSTAMTMVALAMTVIGAGRAGAQEAAAAPTTTVATATISDSITPAPAPTPTPAPVTVAQAKPAPAVTAVVTPPPPVASPAPPAPPYSLPWQLRPVVAANVIRSDSTVAFYENAAGVSGSTVATMLLASFKVTPHLAPLVRLGFVQNTAPGMAPDGTSFINPIVGATYARPVGSIRLAGFLAGTVPIGQGSTGTAMNSGAAGANSAGIAARSGMDNAMYAVNYFTVIGGIGAAYVAHGFTAQIEATVLQLTRVRTSTGDSSRTNSTAGLHLGYFLIPQLSLGGELRYQRWLSDAAPVKANPVNRETVTVAIGPRAHFKLGKNWFRPGISYARGLDKPLTTASYNMVQVDLPFAF